MGLKTARETDNQSGETGFTLIEVSVSMLVLGIVMVALGQGLTLGIRMNSETKTRLVNLNTCKRVTESLKSQIQYSVAVFDSANANSAFNGTFYADSDSNPQMTTSPTASSMYRVTATVGNVADSGGNTYSSTDGAGVSHAIVKYLDVTVVSLQSAIGNNSGSTADSSREVKMRVEMVRPAS
jgi:prepilin-type N-terminal cleavage/methylation domain-containing protein